MPFAWLYGIAGRKHLPVVPGVVLLVSIAVYLPVALLTEGGYIRSDMSNAQFFGTLGLFTILPSYLLAMIALQWRRTERALDELQGLGD